MKDKKFEVRSSLIIAALAGIALAIGLVAYFGAAPVREALTTAGWRVIVIMCFLSLISMVLCAYAWRAVLLEQPARPLSTLIWARYVRDSLGNLIGIIPATGELASARELTLHGLKPGIVGASVIVDLTAELLSQVIFTMMGVAVLVSEDLDRAITSWLVAGIAVSAIAIIGFIIAQHRGLFHLLETLPEKQGWTKLWSALPPGERLHDAIAAIYREPWRMLTCVSLHLAAWIFAGLETWIALKIMGHQLSPTQAIALESLVFAARTSAFLVPWAAGIQEGGYVLVGTMLGIPPASSLALSLLKRAREIILGVPGLLAWQGLESRRLLSPRALSEEKEK